MLIPPQGPMEAYKTYSISQRPDTDNPDVCRKAGCLNWRYGWDTRLDESTDIGRIYAKVVRQSGRDYREMRDGTVTVFRFDPGQRCFAEHGSNPVHYRVSGAHWQMPRPARPVLRDHVTPADWVEDFAEHQQGLADRLAKG